VLIAYSTAYMDPQHIPCMVLELTQASVVSCCAASGWGGHMPSHCCCWRAARSALLHCFCFSPVKSVHPDRIQVYSLKLKYRERRLLSVLDAVYVLCMAGSSMVRSSPSVTLLSLYETRQR
jgi:hypothetical protein